MSLLERFSVKDFFKCVVILKHSFLGNVLGEELPILKDREFGQQTVKEDQETDIQNFKLFALENVQG
jgi:hypothetical protein